MRGLQWPTCRSSLPGRPTHDRATSSRKELVCEVGENCLHLVGINGV